MWPSPGSSSTGNPRSVGAPPDYGIRVNCVAPGLVKTPLTQRITGNETLLRASVAMHPLQRIGEPADVVSAMVWLADPRNGWITGQILDVDGGLGSVRSRH